jgi:hypothetical protein
MAERLRVVVRCAVCKFVSVQALDEAIRKSFKLSGSNYRAPEQDIHACLRLILFEIERLAQESSLQRVLLLIKFFCRPQVDSEYRAVYPRARSNENLERSLATRFLDSLRREDTMVWQKLWQFEATDGFD